MTNAHARAISEAMLRVHKAKRDKVKRLETALRKIEKIAPEQIAIIATRALTNGK